VESEAQVLDAADPLGQSITPRCADGMISPPGMLTVCMPMRWNTSAAMPVWRHFMPLKSARFLIGRLNQPKA